MLPEQQDRIMAMAESYDAEARATGWMGPEVAFGLIYEHILPGQTVLDIGIGTGLSSALFRKAGLEVHGMDLSRDMLDACRLKGFDHLTEYDLTKTPYPYAAESFDHVVCLGVLSFFSDLSPVFAESARILKPAGLFVFMTIDRTAAETFEMVVGPEYTKTGETVTMYRHSNAQIGGWIDRFGFELLKCLLFTLYMDREKKRSLRAACYVARKTPNASLQSSVGQ